MKEIGEHIKALEQESFYLPPISMTIVTVKVASARLRDAKVSEWLGCIAFWRGKLATAGGSEGFRDEEEEGEENEEDDLEWTFASPKLAAVLPSDAEIQAEAEADDAAGEEGGQDKDDLALMNARMDTRVLTMKTAFFEAFYNDHVLSLYQDVGKDENKKLLLAFHTAFVAEALPIARFAESCNEKLKSLATAAEYQVKASRGIIALLSPRPGEAGSTPDDVDFLLGSSSNARKRRSQKGNHGIFCITDVSAHARPALQVLKDTGNTAWAPRLKAYADSVAAESAKLKIFSDLEDKLANLLNPVAAPVTPGGDDEEFDAEVAAASATEVRNATIKEAMDALPDLQKKLRAGACDKILTMMEQIFESDYQGLEAKAASAGDTGMSAVIDSMKALADLVKTLRPFGQKLHIKINDKVLALSTENRLATLSSCLLSRPEDPLQVRALVDALTASKGKALSEEHADHMGDTRELLWKYMATTFRRDDWTPDSTEPAITALNLISRFAEVRKMLVDNGPDISLVPVQIGTAVHELRKSLVEAQALVAGLPQGDCTELNLLARTCDALNKKFAKYDKDDNGLSGPCHIWSVDMLTHARGFRDTAQVLLGQQARRLLEAKKTGLVENSAKLQVIAGGHPTENGLQWHDGVSKGKKFPYVLELAQSTLMKCKGSVIDAATQDLNKAPFVEETKRGRGRGRGRGKGSKGSSSNNSNNRSSSNKSAQLSYAQLSLAQQLSISAAQQLSGSSSNCCCCCC